MATVLSREVEARPLSQATVAPVRERIASLDIIRGAVMVLMAIDHVRVYSGVPPGGPMPGVFFTRWVTHFSAPAFFLLAGTAAFLHGAALPSRGVLSRFLVTRGAWLILLEMTVIRLSWTFNIDYGHYMLAGVIWALGWCMILMAVLVHLPFPVIAALGIATVFGHNLADPHVQTLSQSLSKSSLAWLWQVLYFGGGFKLFGGPPLIVLYSLIPWIGVMAAGYAFGPIMKMEPERRRQFCFAIGGGAIALFLVLRGFNLYGNPQPWGRPGSSMPAVLSFLSTNKYPASLLFLLMTLGPTIVAIPLLDGARGAVARVLTVFGRVPLFFYLLHIPLIHAVALLISAVRTPGATSWLFANHPMMVPPPPDGYAWSLPLLYLVTAGVVFLLYFPCRWYARIKATRRSPWLSYL